MQQSTGQLDFRPRVAKIDCTTYSYTPFSLVKLVDIHDVRETFRVQIRLPPTNQSREKADANLSHTTSEMDNRRSGCPQATSDPGFKSRNELIGRRHWVRYPGSIPVFSDFFIAPFLVGSFPGIRSFIFDRLP